MGLGTDFSLNLSFHICKKDVETIKLEHLQSIEVREGNTVSAQSVENVFIVIYNWLLNLANVSPPLIGNSAGDPMGSGFKSGLFVLTLPPLV